MSDHINKTRIKAIHNGLGDLKDKVVFVGGATVSLYADELGEDVRFTDDVDIVIEMYSYSEQFALEEKLRQMGFANDTESGIICRYIYKGFIVDIMPAKNKWLGFSNKWYPEAYENSVDCNIDELNTVRIFSSPYFIATKLEAFKGRGENDGRTSHDFGDIVFVLSNREKVWDELNAAPETVKKYLREEFGAMNQLRFFSEWIESHLEEKGSVEMILNRLADFLSD